MTYTMHHNCLRVIAVLVCVLGVGGCGDHASRETGAEAAPAMGLAAIPDSAQVIVVADVKKLAASPLVARAVHEMMARDAALKARFEVMSAACGVDFSTDIDRALIGLGDDPGEVVLVVDGRLRATDLAACAGGSLRKGGGNVTSAEVGGHPAYHAVSGDGRTDVWFAQTGAATVVSAASEDYLAAAIGNGPKIETDKGLGALLSRAKKGAGLRFAGRISPAVGHGIVTRTGGQIAAPPKAVAGHVALADGLDLELSFIMASPADAAAVAAIAPAQLAVLAQVAQQYRLGSLVEAIDVTHKDDVVTVSVALPAAALAAALSPQPAPDGRPQAIDSDAGAAQNPGPTNSPGRSKPQQ